MRDCAAQTAFNQEVQFHRRLVRPGTFVDIGAHVGDFTLAMANLPGLALVAIEPLPSALALLRGRIQKAGLSVEIIGVALADKAGPERRLSVPLLSTGPVWEWASLVKDFTDAQQDHPEIVSVQSYPVPVLTLDGLELTRVRAIKLDVEGAEYEVLRGGRRLLTEQRPIISIELEERHRTGCTYAVPAFLDAFGYVGFFDLAGKYHDLSAFDRSHMQRGSRSPAGYEYSDPYVGCFYFIPRERADLIEQVSGDFSS